jgi:hypothetical protein
MDVSIQHAPCIRKTRRTIFPALLKICTASKAIISRSIMELTILMIRDDILIFSGLIVQVLVVEAVEAMGLRSAARMVKSFMSGLASPRATVTIQGELMVKINFGVGNLLFAPDVRSDGCSSSDSTIFSSCISTCCCCSQ